MSVISKINELKYVKNNIKQSIEEKNVNLDDVEFRDYAFKIEEITEGGFSGDYNDLINKPTLFDGDYNSLTNKPTIPSVTGLATETYVDNKDTIKEQNDSKSIKFWAGTKAEYDLISTKDSNTLYFIEED